MKNVTEMLSCIESELEKMRLEVCNRLAVCSDLSAECSTVSGVGSQEGQENGKKEPFSCQII